MGRDKFLEELGMSARTNDLKDTPIEVIDSETAHDSSENNDHRLGVEALPKNAKVRKALAQTGDDHESGSGDVEEAVAEVVAKPANGIDLERRLVEAEQERDTAIARLKTLEDSHEQEAQATKAEAKQLSAQREAAEKEARAARAELEQSIAELQEVKARLEKAEETLKATACPSCGKIQLWRSRIQEMSQSEFERIDKTSIFPFDFSGFFGQKTVHIYPCPYCGPVKLEEKNEEE